MSFYAFKGFEHDLSCRDFQYEIGKTYILDGSPIKCQQGFHYCTSLRDVFNYYPRYLLYHFHSAEQWILSSNRYCIVEVLGDVDGQTSIHTDTKGATNKIRIVKELSQNEIDDILNKYELSIRYDQLWNSYLFNFKEEKNMNIYVR